MKLKVNAIYAEIFGEGEPLLLLHGFTGSMRSWDAFVPGLSKDYQVIVVDLHGHGQADSPEDPDSYTTERTVQDLVALLDELQLTSVHVLGYSMGGRIALSLAMLAPARVRSLILESSSPGLASAEERAARIASDHTLASRIERDGLAAFVTHWENIPLFASLRRMPDSVQQAIREQRMRNNPTGLANSLRGIGTGSQPSWWSELHKLSMPVLLLAGELDEKFDRIAQTMLPQIPHGRYTRISDAGHALHIEQPAVFQAHVLSFLNTP